MSAITNTTRTVNGTWQFCRGALEAGQPRHRCTTYTTLHYGPQRRFHFCDEHPAKEAATAQTWDLSSRSDVYLGRPNDEDGSQVDHLSFYVVAENKRGERYAHFMTWTTEQMGRQNAEEAANSLAAKVTAAQKAGRWSGPAGTAHWVRIDPAYGSEAYTPEVAFEQDQLEARANGEEREFLESASRAGRIF